MIPAYCRRFSETSHTSLVNISILADTFSDMDTDFLNKLQHFTTLGYAILLDDASPYGQASFVAPARSLKYQQLNDILRLAKGGITSVAITSQCASLLELQPMARPRTNTSRVETTYCTSVDAREGITTGISVADRITTINILGDTSPLPRQLVKPGHVFPIEVVLGGVLVKHAQPEAALDLVKLLDPSQEAAFFMDILDDKGNFLPISDQRCLAEENNIPYITISEIVEYRLGHEQLVQRVAQAKLPSSNDLELNSFMYKSKYFYGEHIAFVHGKIDPEQPVLTRVQLENTVADVFGGTTPPTREHLQSSLKEIRERGCGILLYLRSSSDDKVRQQLTNTRQSETTETGVTTEIMREYGIGAQILYDLGARKIELLSNSTKNLVGLKSYGIEIVSQTPLSSH